ncbi:hypothetical protein [Prevotella fusca]
MLEKSGVGLQCPSLQLDAVRHAFVTKTNSQPDVQTKSVKVLMNRLENNSYFCSRLVPMRTGNTYNP